MKDIELHKEYATSGQSVHDLFDRREEGFYVPLYQREYTWEASNISQLFDDLFQGVQGLCDNSNAATFLGTTILLSKRDNSMTVKPSEKRAEPTAVQIVVDGQQRISTLALLSMQISMKLETLIMNLSDEEPYCTLRKEGYRYLCRLRKLHTIKLGMGAIPSLKPKIIREGEDSWTCEGDDSVYKSPIARCISTFIRTNKLPDVAITTDDDNENRLLNNIKIIKRRLDDVCKAQIHESELFPVTNITEHRIQEFVLGGLEDSVKDKIKRLVDKRKGNDSNTDNDAVASYRLMLLTYYLLRRCGVSRLQPAHEEWGFDMYQALNATGQPLTVIETFKPLVMQVESSLGIDWGTSKSREHIERIERMLLAGNKKQSRTESLIRSFALCYEGRELGNKFSKQRSWLTDVYLNKSSTIEQKSFCLDVLAKTADFYYYSWHMNDNPKTNYIEMLKEHKDKELATLLIQYLREANSLLSAPILSLFYRIAIDDNRSLDPFIECVKACAAFFTLWRPARESGYLPKIYRGYFKKCNILAKGSKDINEQVVRESVNNLKSHFLEALENEDIAECSKWIKEPKPFLRYPKLKRMHRFLLFLAAHKRVPSRKNNNYGLTDKGRGDSCSLLDLKTWRAIDHKSIEHIAPQKQPINKVWDNKIYDDKIANQIGNMILLQEKLNQYTDNKEWPVKYLYYSLVGEDNDEQLSELITKMKKDYAITLKKDAIDEFKFAKYGFAIKPILSVGPEGKWNAESIKKRTEHLLENAGTILFEWLKPKD